MAKRKRRHKTTVDEELDLMNKRRCGNFPEQWDRISLEQSMIDAERAQCLIEGRPIQWEDVVGRQ